MKIEYYFLLLVIFSLLVIGCGIIPHNHDHFKDSHSNIDKEGQPQFDTLTKEGYPCHEVKLWGQKIKCIYESAYYGDPVSIESLIINMNDNKEQVFFRTSSSWRMRGKRVFDLMLNLSNNYECDHNLGLDGRGGLPKIHYILNNVFDMIENIEGLNVEDYITSKMPKDIYKLIEGENCSMDTFYKMKWEILNLAWQEGKIKLKDFGQE